MTTPVRTSIATSAAPAAIGPYSQAIWSDGLLFLSGQIALDPASGNLVEGGVAEQTEAVFANIAAVLAAGGSSLDDVVKTTVFLLTMDDFAAMNDVYVTKFAAPAPARSTVAVAGLPRGARVEIEAIARRQV